MARITPISWSKLVRVFKRAGYKVDRQKGSHIVMVREGSLRSIVIPKKKEISVGIIKSNLNTANIDHDLYLNILNDC